MTRMSECSIEQVKCPRCQYDSPITIWHSINADLDPELKEKLLKGELYHWECEVCGLETDVPFGTLYYDMANKFMIFFSPWENEENNHEKPELPIPFGKGLSDYTFRIVFGMNELREKISIFEYKLNDIVIERLKFFLKLDQKYNLLPEDALFFLGIDADSEQLKSSGMERGAIVFIHLTQGKDPQMLALPMEQYYDYLLATKIDPRMQSTKNECIDEEWIKRKLQKM